MHRFECCESQRQTDFSTRMRECNTQLQIFEAIHRTLVDFRRRGVMSPLELQGMSVLSADQLGRWAAASRRAFAGYAGGRTGSDGDPTALMVELLCSANDRLAQLSSKVQPCSRRSCRETDTHDGGARRPEKVVGTTNE
jgi:hypothetical protein